MFSSRKKGCLSPTMFLIFVFCFSVFAPYPLQAEENLRVRASLLTNAGDFLNEDWNQTKDDMVSVREFFKRDWERTRKDFKAVAARLGKLKRSMTGGKGISQKTWATFESKIMKLADKAIDEVGVTKLGNMLHKKCDGKMGFTADEVSAGSEEIQKMHIRQSLTDLLEKMRTVFEKMSRKDMKKVLSESDRIAAELKNGKTLDEIRTMRSGTKRSGFWGGSAFTVGEKIFFAAIGLLALAGAIGIPAVGLYFIGTFAFGLSSGTAITAAGVGSAVIFAGFCAASTKAFQDTFFTWFGK